MAIMDFPDGYWFKANYPDTQKISKVAITLEKASRGKCSCISVYSYDRCDVCRAKGVINQMLMLADSMDAKVLMLKYGKKK